MTNISTLSGSFSTLFSQYRINFLVSESLPMCPVSYELLFKWPWEMPSIIVGCFSSRPSEVYRLISAVPTMWATGSQQSTFFRVWVVLNLCLWFPKPRVHKCRKTHLLDSFVGLHNVFDSSWSAWNNLWVRVVLSFSEHFKVFGEDILHTMGNLLLYLLHTEYNVIYNFTLSPDS